MIAHTDERLSGRMATEGNGQIFAPMIAHLSLIPWLNRQALFKATG